MTKVGTPNGPNYPILPTTQRGLNAQGGADALRAGPGASNVDPSLAFSPSESANSFARLFSKFLGETDAAGIQGFVGASSPPASAGAGSGSGGSPDFERIASLLSEKTGQPVTAEQIQGAFEQLQSSRATASEGAMAPDFEMMAEKLSSMTGQSVSAEQLQALFDPNGDGQVSQEEGMAAFEQMGAQPQDDLAAEARDRHLASLRTFRG